MKLSVVTTIYNSSAYINEFYERSTAAATKVVGDDYEIIFVNDGSPDESLEQARILNVSDKAIKIVDLSRNYGHHKAMMAGLEHASGDMIFLIDCDLEEEPEWLIIFYEMMHTSKGQSLDVVYGVQSKRKGSWFDRVTGTIFYWLMNKISSTIITPNAVTARLMTKRYVDALMSYREREFYIPVIWGLTGFEQNAVSVKKHNSSPTTYNLKRKFSLAINSMLANSAFPLRFLCVIGSIIFLISLTFIGYITVKYYTGIPVQLGWSSLIASIWLFGGLVIFSIGIVGLYIDKVFMEVKGRPRHTVRELIGFNSDYKSHR